MYSVDNLTQKADCSSIVSVHVLVSAVQSVIRIFTFRKDTMHPQNVRLGDSFICSHAHFKPFPKDALYSSSENTFYEVNAVVQAPSLHFHRLGERIAFFSALPS